MWRGGHEVQATGYSRIEPQGNNLSTSRTATSAGKDYASSSATCEDYLERYIKTIKSVAL